MKKYIHTLTHNERIAPEDLQDWIATMGYTQQAAARALGVSLRTISAWLEGKHRIPQVAVIACQWWLEQKEKAK